MSEHPNWRLSGLQSEPNSAPRPGEHQTDDPTVETASTIPGAPGRESPFANETVNTVRTTPLGGGATTDIGEPRSPDPIGLAREGMRVVDASGKEIGKVDRIKMGDPGAATTQGEAMDPMPETSWLGSTVVGTADDSKPEALRAEMLRQGFIHIDSKGWFSKNRIALANQIAGVEGGAVMLSVAAGDLAED